MSLTKTALSGVKWTGMAQVGRQVMQFATSAILAWLLTPADFGLISMATVVVGFAMLFKDLGLGSAIIQREPASNGMISSIFWLNLAFGVTVSAVFACSSPQIANLLNEVRLTPILQALSLTFVFSSLSVVHQALLDKALAFEKIAKVELSTILIGSILGISLALAGWGVWSLVYQMLAVSISTTVMLWRASGWRPRMVFVWAEVRSVWKYSTNLTGFNVLNYLVRNADNILIGRFLGAENLGFYSLAYRLMSYPLQSISGVISRVLFPIYSRLQNDPVRFRQAYLKVVGLIAFITFPMMLGLLVLAGPFVLLAFGPQWSTIIPIVVILAPVGMAQSIGTTVGSIYQAMGRTDWLFRWGLASSFVTVVAFLIGLRWGIIGVAVAYAVASVLILAYPNFAIPFRLIDLSMREFILCLWRPLVCGLIMALALMAVKLAIPQRIPSGLILGLLVPAGIVLYLFTSWYLNRSVLFEVAQLLNVRLRSGRLVNHANGSA